MNKVFKVGLIGCGHISETYFRAEKYFNNIKIVKCADINHANALKCAKTYKIKALSVKDLLKDQEVEIILNLTIPKAHYQVAKQSLLNGKHVYSEKPMAINFKDGLNLVKIAKRKKLYIGNAPDTFLGGGIQKSKELVEKNIIGKISLGNAIFAFPGVQSYHPNPEPWFAKKEGGPVIDMGPYYLTALVNLLGPAKKVTGSIMEGVKRRTIGIGPKKNKTFKVECPTTYLSTIQFENGTIIRLTLSFDVIAHQRNHIELYGSKGSMIVPDPNMFGGSVYVCNKLGDPWKEYKTNKMHLGKINIRSQSSRANESPTNANYRGAGLAEMAYSIENKKINKCNGELSLHVLDIIQSTMKACKTNKPQVIKTTCKKPSLFNTKDIKKILK
ncbi:Gfo/Idh/MocA family protein [Candidatus Pelagibacter sp. HIMB1715]|uniref:Gfo/Idh/MocA family protein n=1 Tax=Candidatus Pelagibacter sp. HIMB1715 TaxID=3413369 RepID=UPI003F84D19D